MRDIAATALAAAGLSAQAARMRRLDPVVDVNTVAKAAQSAKVAHAEAAEHASNASNSAAMLATDSAAYTIAYADFAAATAATVAKAVVGSGAAAIWCSGLALLGELLPMEQLRLPIAEAATDIPIFGQDMRIDTDHRRLTRI